MAVDITETMWRRGWNDTKRGWTDWRFVIGDMVALPLFAVFVSLPVALGVAAMSLFLVWLGATASAPVRQRNEARLALANHETPFAFTERGPFHVPPLGLGIGGWRLYTPLSIRNQGSETATVEGITVAISLGFRKEGTGWGTEPGAAVPSFLEHGVPRDPSERSWRAKENSELWELLGLPAVVRGGGELVLPNIGVEIVNESKVREAYRRPEGALLDLDVHIHSTIGSVRIRHIIPVAFVDEAGADLVTAEP